MTSVREKYSFIFISRPHPKKVLVHIVLIVIFCIIAFSLFSCKAFSAVPRYFPINLFMTTNIKDNHSHPIFKRRQFRKNKNVANGENNQEAVFVRLTCKSFSGRLVSLTASGLTFLMLAVISFIVDPVLIIARYQVKMAPGFRLYDIMRREIAGAYVDVYLFNVTNGEQFLRGEDRYLRVQDVGPFVYQEIRLNKNFTIDEEAVELHYQPYITTRFLPERSIADPATINISIVNPVLLALAATMSSSSSWSQWGFNVLTTKYKSKGIQTLSAEDYLWGFEEPLLAFCNTFMPGWINFSKFGVMDRFYDNTRDNRIELSLKENEKFQVKRVNGEGGMPYWGYADPNKRSRCNTYEDTYEAFAYPPGLSPDRPIRAYRNIFCRVMELDYVGTKTVDFGPEAYQYKISNRTYSMGPDKECLCGRTGCMDGMSDLSPCFYGLPVMMSNGHFYGADPKVYERIKGINPSEEKHGNDFLIEPKLGTQLSTSLTLQLNLAVGDVSFNSAAKPFSNMVVPLAHFRVVQPDLSDDLKRVFWIVYVAANNGMLAVEALLFAIGAALLAYVTCTIYCSSKHNPMAFKTPTSAYAQTCETPLMKNS